MRSDLTGSATSGPKRQPGLSPVVLLVAYVGLALAPLGLAALQAPLERNILREISSGLVMVAWAMTLMEFLLSGRFKSISGRTGIDRTMRFHQVAGRIILVLVIAHPLLYAAPRLWPDPANALRSLVSMFGSEGLRSGVIAFVLMIALVPLAVWRDRLAAPYEIWRLSHGLGALAIAAFGSHHTLTAGTYSANPWLSAFWALGAALAALSLVYIYLAKPLLKLRAPWRVVANRRVGERMWEVAVEPERGDAFDFRAGQFAWLSLARSPFSLTEHPFSFSSAPAQRPRIAFTIKESGDFTRRIGAVPVGARAWIDGPHGAFTLAGRQAKALLFIAGGVGIAPIMSMLRQLSAERYLPPVRLIYGNRSEKQILYRSELDALPQHLDFAVRYVLSEPPADWAGLTGELTRDVLDACLTSFGEEDWLIFVCGPGVMMTSVERSLIARGTPPGRIVTERFQYD